MKLLTAVFFLALLTALSGCKNGFKVEGVQKTADIKEIESQFYSAEKDVINAPKPMATAFYLNSSATLKLSSLLNIDEFRALNPLSIDLTKSIIDNDLLDAVNGSGKFSKKDLDGLLVTLRRKPETHFPFFFNESGNVLERLSEQDLNNGILKIHSDVYVYCDIESKKQFKKKFSRVSGYTFRQQEQYYKILGRCRQDKMVERLERQVNKFSESILNASVAIIHTLSYKQLAIIDSEPNLKSIYAKALGHTESEINQIPIWLWDSNNITLNQKTSFLKYRLSVFNALGVADTAKLVKPVINVNIKAVADFLNKKITKTIKK